MPRVEINCGKVQKHLFFFLNVACNLLHEETTTTDLVCVFSGLF